MFSCTMFVMLDVFEIISIVVVFSFRIRLSGLKGVRGVVMKTVSDDLQVNIWEQAHMSKIVPSLLYNMQGLQ